jgi:curved DNA-binding protein CbpA
VLNVQPSATYSEIRKAYQKLLILHHPDKGGDTAKFQMLTEAYEVLSDDTRRSDYDNELQNVVLSGADGDGAILGFTDNDGNVWVSELLLKEEEEVHRKFHMELQAEHAKLTRDEGWAHEEAVRVLEDKISRLRADYEDQIATHEKSLENVTQKKNLDDLRAQYSLLQAQQLSQDRQQQLAAEAQQLALQEELQQQTAAAQQLHAKHDALQQQLQEERDKQAAERAAAQELQDKHDRLQQQLETAYDVVIEERKKLAAAAAAAQEFQDLQDKYGRLQQQLQEERNMQKQTQIQTDAAVFQVSLSEKLHVLDKAALAKQAASAQELQDKHDLLQRQLQEERKKLAAAEAAAQEFKDLQDKYDLLQSELVLLRPKLPKLCTPPAPPTGPPPKWFPPKPPAPPTGPPPKLSPPTPPPPRKSTS